MENGGDTRSGGVYTRANSIRINPTAIATAILTLVYTSLSPPPKKEIEGGAHALGPLLFVRLPERPAQSYRGVVEPEEPDNAPSHPGHLLGSVPPLRGPRLPLASGEDPVKSLGVTLPLALLPFPFSFSFRFARRGEERKGETAGASVWEIRGRIETWLLAGEPGNARHRHRTFPSTFRK